MAAHQAPPSLGFSKQEHWSGLPFPSPMHENDKWKWNCSVVSNPQRPHGLQPSRLLCPWDFPGKSTGVGCQHTYIKSYKYFTSSGRPVSSLLWHRWPRTRKILFLGMLSVCEHPQDNKLFLSEHDLDLMYIYIYVCMSRPARTYPRLIESQSPMNSLAILLWFQEILINQVWKQVWRK